MVCLFLMIVFWVGSSFSIQLTLTKFNFHGVFFTTYVINTVFSFILLFRWGVLKRFKRLPGIRGQVPVSQYVRWASMFGPMWCVMNAALNSSLQYTSVASNNSLSTLSSAFALLAGFILVRNVPNLWKIMGIACT
jgi:drug/metabolite transporter (DMT)-like permease